jgi:hypothetical protein
MRVTLDHDSARLHRFGNPNFTSLYAFPFDLKDVLTSAMLSNISGVRISSRRLNSSRRSKAMWGSPRQHREKAGRVIICNVGLGGVQNVTVPAATGYPSQRHGIRSCIRLRQSERPDQLAGSQYGRYGCLSSTVPPATGHRDVLVDHVHCGAESAPCLRKRLRRPTWAKSLDLNCSRFCFLHFR